MGPSGLAHMGPAQMGQTRQNPYWAHINSPSRTHLGVMAGDALEAIGSDHWCRDGVDETDGGELHVAKTAKSSMPP